MGLIEFFKTHKQKFADVILSTIAYAMPAFATQIIVLPTINRCIGEVSYGYVITTLSLMSLIPQTIGGALNNTALIMRGKYTDFCVLHDTNRLFVNGLPVGMAVFFIAWFPYRQASSIIHLILLLILFIFWLLREYIAVEFRLQINYLKICLNNFILMCSFILTVTLFKKGCFGDHWELVYIVSLLCGAIYVLFNTTGFSRLNNRTHLFKETRSTYLKLVVSNVIGAIGENLDKLIIFSILGASTVSVFYAATIFTKIIALAFTPVSGVLLSYLSKSKGISLSQFTRVLLLSLSLATLGFFAGIIIAKPVIGLLYPMYLKEASKYIYLTTAYAMIGMVYVLLRPYLLRFKNTNWVIVINSLSVISFVILSLLLTPRFGIVGLCVAHIARYALRILLICYVFFRESLNTYML